MGTDKNPCSSMIAVGDFGERRGDGGASLWSAPSAVEAVEGVRRQNECSAEETNPAARCCGDGVREFAPLNVVPMNA